MLINRFKIDIVSLILSLGAAKYLSNSFLEFIGYLKWTTARLRVQGRVIWLMIAPEGGGGGGG
jgi:hypothetical protein